MIIFSSSAACVKQICMARPHIYKLRFSGMWVCKIKGTDYGCYGDSPKDAYEQFVIFYRSLK